MSYTPPHIGKQTVQTYHPERGAKFAYQISTYCSDGCWIINFCSPSMLEETKRSERARAAHRDCIRKGQANV